MRFLILVTLFLAVCAAPVRPVFAQHDAPDSETPVWDGEVRVYGALRAIFHEGQIGTQVTLDPLLPSNDLYAVGALSDLAGEITIVAGKVYLTYPERDAARTDMPQSPDAGATLLVSTRVPQWQSYRFESIVSFEELDDAIARLAKTAGLDPQERFPFLIEGPVEDLHWHVVDGRRLAGGGTTHQDHLAAAVTGHRERTEATLIGFSSAHDQGVFTHMGSTTHAHCVLEEPLLAGHVDHVVLPAGTTVKLPGSGSRPRERGDSAAERADE